jgi:Protein of unknown function (DUF3299)
MSTSAPLQMSTEESFDFPYRALSKSAVASVGLAVMGMAGLLLPPALAFSLVGCVLAMWAVRSIRAYPDEFSGLAIAKFGLVFNAVLLVGGIAYHTYVYATEVPEGYTRLNFYDLQQPEGAAQLPTDAALAANGKDVFIKGYVHPTSGGGKLRRFILVPDAGTCCFGGQPKSSDMIDVTLADGETVKSNLLKKRLAGKFAVMGVGQTIDGFENGIFYRFKVDQVR